MFPRSLVEGILKIPWEGRGGKRRLAGYHLLGKFSRLLQSKYQDINR